MPEVNVYNRNQACELDRQSDNVLISIQRPTGPGHEHDGYDKFPSYSDWHDSIVLEFHDIYENENGKELAVVKDGETRIVSLVAPSRRHAEDILDFISRHAGRNVDIHCDAGMSRSVAVGVFLEDHFGYTLKTHAVKGSQHYNRTLYRLLLEEKFGNGFADVTNQENPV